MSRREPSPPRLLEALLALCLPRGQRGEALLGDVHEGFVARVESGASPWRVRLWYASQLPRVGLPFLARRVLHPGLYRRLASTPTGPVPLALRGTLLTESWSDARFALRSFRKSPGLPLAATLILGIGIGAITLVFSVFNTAVLRPLPFRDPDELVWLWGESERWSENSISYPDLQDLRAGADAFEDLGGYVVFRQTQFLGGRDGTEQVLATLVTPDLFRVLAVTPELGRSFLPEEERPGARPVAVLGHALWMRRFGGDPGVVGSTLSLDGQPTEIVGVMPSWFDFPAGTDLWVPVDPSEAFVQRRGNNNIYAVGRLRDGVSLEEAQSRLDVVAARIAREYPEEGGAWRVRLVSLHQRLFGDAREMLMILIGIVSLVPVVACANVASLFLARAEGRGTEMASRMAVGASRARLVRQLLTESLVVALGGGVVGVALASAGGVALRIYAPMATPRLQELGIDGTVLGFALLATVLAVPLFGVAPALRGTDRGIAEALKAGGGRSGSRRGRGGTRDGLVVAQVALSLMLLLATGLLVRSYRNLAGQELGFRPEGLAYTRVTLPGYKYDNFEEVQLAWDGIFRIVAGGPGVRSLGAVDAPPVSSRGPTNDVWASERPPATPADRTDATRRYVTEGYFAVAGIALVAGRDFEAIDGAYRDRNPPVIINVTLARQAFPGEEPVGKTLVFDYDVIRNLEVVGVVADVKEADLAAASPPTFYLPARWRPRLNMNVFLRSEGDPLDLAPVLRGAVQAVDPDIPVPTVQTMEAQLGRALFQPRFRSALVGLSALATLVLSAMGLFGVLACFVRRRTREIGIRVALGAGHGPTAGLVLSRGMILVGSGLLLGLGGGVAGGRALRSWLFGVDVLDPLTCAGVALFLVAVALSASLVPALRALRVDPVEVLKAE